MHQRKSSIQQLATAARRRIQKGYIQYCSVEVARPMPSCLSVYDKSGLSIFEETDCYRIYAVLQEDDGASPISKLIDRQHFATLSPAEQQRYIFRLSEAYVFLKGQLENKQGF